MANLTNFNGNPPLAKSVKFLGSISIDVGVSDAFSTEKFIRMWINANFVPKSANLSPERKMKKK